MKTGEWRGEEWKGKRTWKERKKIGKDFSPLFLLTLSEIHCESETGAPFDPTAFTPSEIWAFFFVFILIFYCSFAMEIQTARSPPHVDLQHPNHHQNAGKRLGKRMDAFEPYS